MPPPAVLRILPRVDVALGEGFHQMCNFAKILVIAGALAREQRMQRVVEVVIPLGIESIAA